MEDIANELEEIARIGGFQRLNELAKLIRASVEQAYHSNFQELCDESVIYNSGYQSGFEQGYEQGHSDGLQDKIERKYNAKGKRTTCKVKYDDLLYTT